MTYPQAIIEYGQKTEATYKKFPRERMLSRRQLATSLDFDQINYNEIFDASSILSTSSTTPWMNLDISGFTAGSAYVDKININLEETFCSHDDNYLGIIERKTLASKRNSLTKPAHYNSEEKELLINYLLSIYSLETNNRHRAASKIIFKFIEINFAKSNFSVINTFLEEIDLEQLSQWSISGLVRFTMLNCINN